MLHSALKASTVRPRRVLPLGTQSEGGIAMMSSNSMPLRFSILNGRGCADATLTKLSNRASLGIESLFERSTESSDFVSSTNALNPESFC